MWTSMSKLVCGVLEVEKAVEGIFCSGRACPDLFVHTQYPLLLI